jgi:ADP-ribosylglycohydrolase
VSKAAFHGQGSMGNGGAMRVGPVGAYFADDLDAVVANARASAEVTHAHPDGQAGAIATAVAVAQAWRSRGSEDADARRRLIETALEHTPRGQTRAGLEHALDIDLDYQVATASAALGNGSRVISWDTVPFSLWCAAKHLRNYEESLWATVSALGDRDTTCAIVGSIVAVAVGPDGVPREWRDAREALNM